MELYSNKYIVSHKTIATLNIYLRNLLANEDFTGFLSIGRTFGPSCTSSFSLNPSRKALGSLNAVFMA